MIIHIDNTYIKEYEKDNKWFMPRKKTKFGCKKKYFFSLRSKTQLVFVENCIENKEFMVGYCKHKRGNFPSYLQIAIWIPTFLKAF